MMQNSREIISGGRPAPAGEAVALYDAETGGEDTPPVESHVALTGRTVVINDIPRGCRCV